VAEAGICTELRDEEGWVGMIEIELSSIILDPELQPRVAMDQATVAEYAEEMGEGATFPPVTIFDDGSQRWLADGWHRYHAAQKAGMETINADIKQGSRRDALLFSISANAKHGLRRSRDDKQRSVLALLSDPEWVKLSNRELAKLAGVSHAMVNKYRGEAEGGNVSRSPISAKVWDYFSAGAGLPLFNDWDGTHEIAKWLLPVARDLDETIDHLADCGISPADLRSGKRLMGATPDGEGDFSYMICLHPHAEPFNFWVEIFEFCGDPLAESSCGTATAYKKAITLDRISLIMGWGRERSMRGICAARLSDFTTWVACDDDAEPSYVPPFRDEYPEMFNQWDIEIQDQLEAKRIAAQEGR